MFALCDETLARLSMVWAAAWTPDVVSSIDPQRLFRVVGTRPVDVCTDFMRLHAKRTSLPLAPRRRLFSEVI